MNKHLNKITKLKFQERCICPDVGELLSHYIVDLLSDSAAEEVEEHLIFCRFCREKVLRMDKIRSAAQADKTKVGARDKYEISGATILSLDEFKKNK